MSRLYILSCLMVFMLSSCGYFEYDNYEEPNSGIEGTVVDKKTNELYCSETANSYKIEYYELSWEEAGHANTQARFFWGKIAEFAIILELNGYSDCLKIR